MQDPLDISQEINSALNRNGPIVALESSVIAQGLPAPINVETALAMEECVRNAGAVPATIGIIDGRIKVGLSKDDIERLGQGNAAKVAVRDLPYVVAKKLDGGTTVSSTARIASAVGIFVMATGGIGGIHRNYCETMDASADLWELARTPIVVVCSGVKAILDVPATIEWFESHSVPVYGYATDELPMFYSRNSGISIPKVDSVCEIVDILKTSGKVLGARGANIIAVPVPEANAVEVSGEIEQAILEASENGVKGKALTPYLLGRVAELTGGKSIDANVALLKNNAGVAAEIAVTMYENAQRRMGFMV